MTTRFAGRAWFLRRVPWPDVAKQSPLNPSLAQLQRWKAEGRRFTQLRIAHHMCCCSRAEATRYLDVARAVSRALWLADFTLPERNLCLPAYGVVRLLPGLCPWWSWGRHGQAVHVWQFFQQGALFGLLYHLGLAYEQERSYGLLAASLVLIRSH